MTPQDFHVTWSILVEDAESPKNAAEQAWDTVTDDGVTDLFFEVSTTMDMTVGVDLLADTVSDPVWVPGPTQVADLAQWMSDDGWDISEIIEMIRRPHKYADQFSKMVADRAYDAVAREPEKIDEDPSDATSVSDVCAHCGATIVLDRADDPWFHRDTGEERCDEFDVEFAFPVGSGRS